MVFKRPLLYLSLPSLALVLGLVWYRRRREIDCDTGGDSQSSSCSSSNNNISIKEAIVEEVKATTTNKSYNISIDSNNPAKKTESSADTKLGKSAPIDIVPNTRSPPFSKSSQGGQQIDPEILTSRIKDSEYKTLKSIEEQDFESISPIDLPDSGDRRRFSFTPKIIRTDMEQPVIVKASMAAKISPKNSFAETKYTTECAEDRDSANHSPVNDNHKDDEEIQTSSSKQPRNTKSAISGTANMETRNPPVSSPALSECSLHSNDSGKGSSPPHSIAGGVAPSAEVVYNFVLPHIVVGQIIGRKGTYVNQIKSKTGANVIVKKHPDTNKVKVCSISGLEKEVEAAIKMIRTKLPENRYPNLTMEQIFLEPPQSVIALPSLDTSCLRLQLIEGINNDVIVSTIMTGGHVFFQQPLHPSYPSLNILQSCMQQCYSIEESPALPELTADVICVAPVNGLWYRVQIVSHNPETQTCLVKYLDYGGYENILGNDLRQIRTDFMTVSFQAIECLLSNISPTGGVEWSPEAAEVLDMLTKGIILQAQVAGYSSEGWPEVLLYACISPDNVIFINKELVARGLAEWVEELQ